MWTLTSGCALVDAAKKAEGLADAGTGCAQTEECGDDQGDDASGEDADASVSPTAIAGPDQAVGLATLVELDGSSSYAAGEVTFAWTLSAPTGSSATLSAVDSARTTFWTDLEGSYTLTLVVSGGGGDTSAPDSATITARDPGTTGRAGPDRDTYTGTAVTLEASADDREGSLVTHEWTILSAPPGSTAVLDDPTAAAPVLVPDQEGPYFLKLVVSQDGVEEAPDVARVMSYHPLAPLEHRVVDAEYSRSLARIIMVSENPDRLYVLDPEDGSETSVNLPSPPTSVSVSPDGTHAAVGHDGSVSHVRLTDSTRLVTHAVAVDVLDVVLAGNGRAYVVPRYDSEEKLRCLNLSNGVVTLSTGGHFWASGAFLKLHPSGTRMYAADNGVSPDDIGVYDIGSGTATFLYDSPYHGDHGMCGNLWMSDDGLRIYTRCGSVFRYSELPKNDMEYNGSLEGISYSPPIRHLDHSSLAGKIVVLPDDDPFGDDPDATRSMRIYGDSLLDFERTIDLTHVLTPEAAYPTYGRFAFIAADGTKVFVVVQADESSALLNDYAVVTYELD